MNSNLSNKLKLYLIIKLQYFQPINTNDVNYLLKFFNATLDNFISPTDIVYSYNERYEYYQTLIKNIDSHLEPEKIEKSAVYYTLKSLTSSMWEQNQDYLIQLYNNKFNTPAMDPISLKIQILYYDNLGKINSILRDQFFNLIKRAQFHFSN